MNGPGILVLSGTNSYTGGTFVDAGTLIVDHGGAIPDGTSVTVGAGGTLIFDPEATAGPVADAHLRSSAGETVAVPEPGTLALLAAGLLIGFGVWQRKKRIRMDFTCGKNARSRPSPLGG